MKLALQISGLAWWIGICTLGCQTQSRKSSEPAPAVANQAAVDVAEITVPPDTSDAVAVEKLDQVAAVIWNEPGGGRRWAISYLAFFYGPAQNFCRYVEGVLGDQQALGEAYQRGLAELLEPQINRAKPGLRILSGTTDRAYPDRLFVLDTRTSTWQAVKTFEAYGLAACVTTQ